MLKEAMGYTLDATVRFMRNELSSVYHKTKNKNIVESRDDGETVSNTECNHILRILSALLHHWTSNDHHNSPLLKMEDSNKEFVTKFLCNALAFSFAHALSPLVETE